MQWSAFLDSEGRVTDSEAVRERIFYGGVEPDLRKEVCPRKYPPRPTSASLSMNMLMCPYGRCGNFCWDTIHMIQLMQRGNTLYLSKSRNTKR